MIGINNLLFDLDGTLTDPAEGILNSICYSLGFYPQIPTPPREALLPFIGPPLKDSYRDFFGMDDATAAEAVEHYREYFRPTGIFENEVYAGIPEMLTSLRDSGRRLILATSKPQIFAERILEHFGLSHLFSAVCGSTLDGSHVEKADIIARVLSLYPDITPSDTLMIGDRSYDILGAKANGLRAVGVTYGYGSGTELAESGAFMIAHSVEGLSRLLLPH